MMQLLCFAAFSAVLYALFKKELPTFAVVFEVATILCMSMLFLYRARDVLSWLPSIQIPVGQEAFLALLKSAGIMICADYGRDICKDAGSESMATCISLAGRILVLVVAMPLLESIYCAVVRLSG